MVKLRPQAKLPDSNKIINWDVQKVAQVNQNVELFAQKTSLNLSVFQALL